MTPFPHEFEDLLSAEGRAVLSGQHPLAGVLTRDKFVAMPNLLDERQLPALAVTLSETFSEILEETARKLPRANSTKKANEESLPKVGRQLSIPTMGPMTPLARFHATEIGLMQMCFSASYRRFAEVLAGEPLTSLHTAQVFANRPGDYVGPHTDHHPDEPAVANGYVDMHLTFCTPGVRQQFIVYERDGHLAAMAPIAASGTVTAYRLPLWHYTTPMQAETEVDRRWLVLGSFAYASAAAAVGEPKRE
ncbi:MAG: hypothetical protein QM817_27760 [Archangium sp.]